MREQRLASHPCQVSGFRFDQEALRLYNQFCGFEADTLPLTYLFVASQAAQLYFLSQPELGLKLLGLVHVSVELEQFKELEVGSDYDLYLDLGSQLWTARGLQFELRVEFRRDDKVCASISSHYLMRLAMPGGQPAKRAGQSQATELPDQPQLQWHCPESMGKQYANVSRDYNPIHISQWSAKLFGFKAPIVHGMYSAAKILATAAEQTPSRVSFEFKRPIFLPNELSVYSQDDRRYLCAVNPKSGENAIAVVAQLS